jgi:hypothetical protein
VSKQNIRTIQIFRAHLEAVFELGNHTRELPVTVGAPVFTPEKSEDICLGVLMHLIQCQYQALANKTRRHLAQN